MSKSMLKALKQEKKQQEGKPLWYARGKCYDRRQLRDKQELAKAVSVIPKPEWSYFDVKLREDAAFQDEQQQLLLVPSKPVLVVQLEDTLVSILVLDDGSMLVSKRPGADSFLCSVGEEYELVLLSSSPPAATGAVVKQLLNPRLFSGQLHAQDDVGLARLSSRQLVVTSRPEMANSDPDCVIVVPRYLADGRHEEEGQLMLLTKVLLHLATVPASDDDVWRWALKRIRDQGVLGSIRSGRQEHNYVLGASRNGSFKLQVQRNAAAVTVVNGADPYLPPALEDAKPTLVLDLDETLVSSFGISSTDETTVHLVSKRPGVEEFLARMADKFELVLWTASWQAYADAMVDKVLDPSGAGLFSHRLYAQHLVSEKKDLSKLGRRLDRLVVVDDSDWRYPEQLKNNLVLVPKYFGEGPDCHLERVGKLLERLLASGVEDLRQKSANHTV